MYGHVTLCSMYTLCVDGLVGSMYISGGYGCCFYVDYLMFVNPEDGVILSVPIASQYERLKAN